MESSTILKSDIADELHVEGINYKGYGIIPKLVMLDTELTIEAKGIYAYFASFSGAGNTAFPGRDKIVSDLHINKDSYYKHYNLLIASGYITVNQHNPGGRGEGFKNNVYTLVSCPDRIVSMLQAAGCGSIKASGIRSLGYGFIPKAVMTDPRLSIKAKALYAYYAAFTGAGNSACPSREDITHHLNISKNSLAKYNKELLDLGFIEIVQRHIGGKMGVNDYFLVDNPAAPCTNFSDTQKSDTLISDTQKPDMQISDTNINSTKNKNIIPSFIPSERKSEREVITDIEKAKALPDYVLNDAANIEKAVFYLCDYGKMSDPAVYEDTAMMTASFKYDSYMLFVDALISLLSEPNGRTYNGMMLTRLSLLKRINRYMAEMADGSISLFPLIEASQHEYLKASKITIPKYPLKFMQHMIINALVNGDIEIDSLIVHDLSNNFA